MHISKKVRTFLMLGALSVPILFIIILFIVVTSNKEEWVVGANGSSSSYSVGIPRTTYDTPEEAIRANRDEDYEEEKQLFKIKNNDIIHVYTQNYYDTYDEQGNIVSEYTCFNCYDVLEKDMRYYYLGSRYLSVNFFGEDKFTWEKTFRGDLYDSRSNYDNYFARKIYKSILAWGVSDNPKIESVTVDGQKIDEVHTIDVDGTEYYLWIIYDLQTENKIADVVIEEN